jgi:hypothetical protein
MMAAQKAAAARPVMAAVKCDVDGAARKLNRDCI